MARDDYFVLVYRVLNYLYACLKSGEKPEADAISPGALGINPAYWRYLMGHMAAAGLVSGITASLCAVRLGNVQITPKGIEYLQEDGMMQKAADDMRPSVCIGF